MTGKYKNQIDEKLIDQLISQIDPQDLIKKDGIFSVMKKKLVERALEAEMNHELGYIVNMIEEIKKVIIEGTVIMKKQS